MLFPYVTSKNFAFRILIEICISFWAILILIDANYRPQKSPILISYVVFLLMLTIAGVLGENPFRSFWSNYSRMEGLITHYHLFGFYLLMTTMMKAGRRWIIFFNLSLAVSLLVGLYSFAQSLGYFEVVSIERVDGTFGNPSYLAIYVALHFFIGLYL